MKKITTMLSLLSILIVCATSAIMYLHFEYQVSAILTLVWVSGITFWIKANGFLNNE